MSFLDDVLDSVGKERQGGKGFERGTHEVIIGEAKMLTRKTKKTDNAAVIEIKVFDETDNEKIATCTLWFHSEGGAKMGVTKVLGLLVHSVGDEKKDAVRELGKKLFGSIDTPEESMKVAYKLINDKLIGKKAWLVVEPRGSYKTSSYGDIWHYPAEPKEETVDPLMQPITDLNINDIPEFGDL